MLHDLAAATPACGGKAANLARLIAAGLPVPAGFVLDDAAFRLAAGLRADLDEDEIGHALAAAGERIAGAELPAALVHEVEARAAALGGELAVRSSATLEDAVGGSAAGVFASLVRVPARDVWSAIRAVWMSALTPLAVAYGRRRHRELAIGVIVQRFAAGERVTIYTRPPGKPSADTALVQRAPRALATVARAEVPLAIRAEAAIGATRGADVELVDDAGAQMIVQARPIVHPAPHARVAAPAAITAPLVADGRVWIWDVAHNPDPLSVAQAELVARADPDAMRVCAGYLYYTAAAHPAASTRSAAEIERALGEVLGDEVPPLAEALERYAAFYRIWARELKPLTRRTARAARGVRPSAVEATLFACVRGELDEGTVASRLGALSPAWDVAVPTYGERPGAIARALAAARRIGPPPAAPADEEADLAERDDVWFARAQLLVRRAILARAEELGVDREDAFWIPVEDLLRGGLTADDVRRRASGARNAAARAAKWAMPLVINGEPSSHVGSSETESARVLRGVGTGPRVTGRVVRFATLAAEVSVGTGDVVVVGAVTPALAVAVIGCGAIVSETGGLLDHGAALARELDIPCVVGCRGASSQLADGMVVTVDGDAGSVEIA